MADFAAEVRRFMSLRGMTLRELSRQVNYNAGYLSKLLSGQKPPNGYLASRLDEVLGADGAIEAAAASRQRAPGADAGEAELVAGLAREAVAFGRQAEAASVGMGTIAQLDDAIVRISSEYLSAPPLPLIRRAAEVRAEVFGLLKDRQRLSVARDLYVVAAKCCSLISWAAGDLGHLAAAAAEGRTALILAEEAGHPGAQALALCAMSKAAYWDGQLGRAAMYARQGYERCPPNTTRVLLACQESDAQPPPAAREAISRARRALDDATADDDLGGLFAAGTTRLANYTVSFSLKAGSPAGALDAAAIPGLPGEQVGYGTRCQMAIGAATAHLLGGELDGAAEAVAPVLVLPAEQRYATLAERLSELAGALSRGRYRAAPVASVLSEQIRDWCGTGAGPAALPPGTEDL